MSFSKRRSFYYPPEETKDEELDLKETLDGFKEAFESLDTEMIATREQLRNGKFSLILIQDV